MLVLTRAQGEQIMIGDNIVITVVGGHAVQLGIEAPKEVRVHRREVYDAIHGEKGNGNE